MSITCSKHLEMPAGQLQRGWVPARPAESSGFVRRRCCDFQQKLFARHPHFISSSHLFCKWRATITFHGWRKPSLLLKPGWSSFLVFFFFQINRSQNTS